MIVDYQNPVLIPVTKRSTNHGAVVKLTWLRGPVMHTTPVRFVEALSLASVVPATKRNDCEKYTYHSTEFEIALIRSLFLLIDRGCVSVVATTASVTFLFLALRFVESNQSKRSPMSRTFTGCTESHRTTSAQTSIATGQLKNRCSIVSTSIAHNGHSTEGITIPLSRNAFLVATCPKKLFN
ncbi:hypothetical protein LXL04_011940 [Taraxacum kok-saghyz]